MIELLSIEKLKEYGFNADAISDLLATDNKELDFIKGYKNIFWASNIERKIYSGIDAARKYHLGDGKINFPEYDLDLIPEYYTLKQAKFIDKSKIVEGTLFDEKFNKNRFLEQEISRTKKVIGVIEAQIERTIKTVKQKDLLKKDVDDYFNKKNQKEIYLNWLNKIDSNNKRFVLPNFSPDSVLNVSSPVDNNYKSPYMLSDPELVKMADEKVQKYFADKIKVKASLLALLPSEEAVELIIDQLVESYQVTGEFQDCFKVDEYISILRNENTYIQSNVNNNQEEFNRHFLFTQYSPAQKFCLICSLMNLVNGLTELTNERLQITKDANNPHFQLESVLEQLNAVWATLKFIYKGIQKLRKYHFDEVKKLLSDKSDQEKIINYRQLIIESKQSEAFQSYPYYYTQFIKCCEAEIEKIEVTKVVETSFDLSTETKKETVISTYLTAVEKISASFRVNREPDSESVLVVTTKLHELIKALREIYFSDSKEKESFYKVIFDVISDANFNICRENFDSNSYSNMWRAIDHSLSTALSYVSELHFKESDKYFPYPAEDAEIIKQTQSKSKSHKQIPKTIISITLTQKQEKLADLFLVNNWEKYINALVIVTPKLLNKEWRFIGNRKKHIGVICSWIKDLQYKHIINSNISRSKLAAILNEEFDNFNMGKDGKTFHNYSKEYKAVFEQQLIQLTK